MNNIHAEIEYVQENGLSIHSDICPPDCKFNINNEYREFLHNCLDEWLDKSNGTGGFYIKEEKYHFDMYYGEKE